MNQTFQALGVIVLALLPGALYVWSLERQVGAWGVRLSDRFLRFVGVSAVFHAVAAPASYAFYLDVVASGRLRAGDLPVGALLLPLAYVAVPILIGSLAGVGMHRGWMWAKLLAGPNPAPRAWDYLFAGRPDGWIRLRLKSETWLGGAFSRVPDGPGSYAAGYPEDQDLLLAEAFDVDPNTGEFRVVDGKPVGLGSAILVRWDEVEYLEFIDA